MIHWDDRKANEISLSILMRVVMEVGVGCREKLEKSIQYSRPE